MSESFLPPDLVQTLKVEAELLGIRLATLMKAGFTREEAMAIILAAVPNAPRTEYMEQVAGGT